VSNRVMLHLVISDLLLAVFTALGAAQDKAKPKGGYEIQRCAPRLISKRSGNSPEFYFRKGEKHKHSPVVVYEILESGEIAHPLLKRSSGVREVDKYALKWVQELQFNKRPGRDVVDSTLEVTIHFR
jgi:TonB family protein